MSATATAAAPAAAGLAKPAGPWKKLSKAMTAEIPAIAGRPVPVACAPGAGLGHPACYLPLVPVIEVDGKLLGIAPATANPASPADRQRYPVTWGALIHEGAHAAHSTFCPPPAPTANWCEAAHQLEESRAEHRQVTRRPGDRRWLRATVTRLILDDFTAPGADPSDPREAGSAAALILAREDAGILEPAETAPVAAKVEAAIGPDALARLRATWREAHQTADGDARTMVRLARRWCRILGLDPDAAPPAPAEIDISDLLDAIREAIDAISEAVEADFAPPPPPFPPGPGTRGRERRPGQRRPGSPRHLRPQVPRPGGHQHPRPPRRRGIRRPPPRPVAEADHRRRTRQGHHHQQGPARPAPHGQGPRLPGPARRRRDPHRRALHQHPQPPDPRPAPASRHRLRHLRLHGRYTGPVASAAWILGRAASHVPAATTATVLYGARVHALTWPGETPARVTDFDAPDFMHQAGLAIDALDGALGLSRPGTARLLALVTDTNYTEIETQAAQRRITRLHRAGCGVIILRPRDSYRGDHEWTDCQVIEIDNPAGTIDAIARAATRALTA